LKDPNLNKGERSMTRRIAILVLAMGMCLGLANRITTLSLAQSQEEKMSGEKMEGKEKTSKKKEKKEKKAKKEKKGEMEKMGEPKS
jgi:hypothetical protein